jgi:hypothetical protein
MARVEILCNAPSRADAARFLGGAEIYANIVNQQVTRELQKNFPAQLREFLQATKNEPIKRLLQADIDQVVDDYVSISVVDWGRSKKK